jgi:hypothetical protein
MTIIYASMQTVIVNSDLKDWVMLTLIGVTTFVYTLCFLYAYDSIFKVKK